MRLTRKFWPKSTRQKRLSTLIKSTLTRPPVNTLVLRPISNTVKISGHFYSIICTFVIKCKCKTLSILFLFHNLYSGVTDCVYVFVCMCERGRKTEKMCVWREKVSEWEWKCVCERDRDKVCVVLEIVNYIEDWKRRWKVANTWLIFFRRLEHNLPDFNTRFLLLLRLKIEDITRHFAIRKKI